MSTRDKNSYAKDSLLSIETAKKFGWEIMLVGLLIAVNIMNVMRSEHYNLADAFLSAPKTFLDRGAFIALPMSFVLVIGYIDISVASIVALSSVTMGVAFNAGLPMPLAIGLCFLVGIVCGMINGVLLTKFSELAPMIVTLSTQIIYRGIATVMLEDRAATGFPSWFSFFGNSDVGPVPFITIMFIICAVLFGILLHKTIFGRQLYSMGFNMTASKYSGINTDKNIIVVYTLNGFMSALTAIFLTSRMASTRYNIAMSYEMDAIAMAVLGGVSTSGGKGRLIGVIIACFIIGQLRFGLGLTNINPQMLMIVIGALLIVAVAMPELKGLFDRIKNKFGFSAKAE